VPVETGPAAQKIFRENFFPVQFEESIESLSLVFSFLRSTVEKQTCTYSDRTMLSVALNVQP
jgi:hypothetical protein